MRLFQSLNSVLFGAVILASAPGLAAGGVSNETGESDPRRSVLPPAAQGAISRTIGQGDPSFHASRTADGLRVSNPSHDFQADFSRGGVVIDRGPDRVAIAFRAAGYGDALSPVPQVIPRAQRNRIEYRRETVTEWYENGPFGLEQGFTLESPPERRAAGPLTLELSISGSLSVSVESGGRSLTLGRGEAALRYAGLTAVDAAGRELPARLELAKNVLLVRVEDAGARYPVVVDPFFFRASLYPSNFGGGGHMCCSFGKAVAVSGDTIVIGAPNPRTALAGEAFVFVKPPSGWANMTQSARLTALRGGTGDLFGTSVDIDGDTVVVGAIHSNPPSIDKGTAYVFVRPAGGWSGTLHESASLTASDGLAGDQFGSSASVSGTTVVIGAPLHDQSIDGQLIPNKGSAYVFVKPAGGWAGSLTQNARLRASAGFFESVNARFGSSVGVNGNTVVVGAPLEDVSGQPDQGAAYVFVEPSGGWTGALAQSAKLLSPFGSFGDTFGASVGIDGDTALIGSPQESFPNSYWGLAHVFVRPAGGWAGTLSPAAILSASDGVAAESFGKQVAVSGNRVLASTDVNAGAIYIFEKPAAGWTTTHETQKMITPDDTMQFFDLSGDTIVGGSDAKNYADVFVRVTSVPVRN